MVKIIYNFKYIRFIVHNQLS